MTERVDKPASAADVGWRTSATPANGAIDPGAPVRLNGWAVDTIPGSQEFNWIQELIGDLLLWLQPIAVRQFTTLKEGVDNCDVRDLFRVVPPSPGDLYQRLISNFSTTTTATGGLTPSHICCDGGQVYYVAGTGDRYIVAASPDDGSEIWELNPLSAQVSALCCDGDHIFYVSDALNPGLFRRERDSSGASNAGATYGHDKLVANGTHVAGIRGNTGNGDVDIWVTDPISLVATVPTGSPGLGLVDLAIDSHQVYVGGVRHLGSAREVWARYTANGALAWQAQLDPNVFTIRSICTDGRFVYVGTDDGALAAGGNANLFVLDRRDGTILSSYRVDGAINLMELASDGEYLYAVGSNHYCYQIPLPIVGNPSGAATGYAGTTTRAGNVDSGAMICTDGFQIYHRDQATPTQLNGIFIGGPPRLFTRVNGDDPNRRPIYTRAIPIEGRV